MCKVPILKSISIWQLLPSLTNPTPRVAPPSDVPCRSRYLYELLAHITSEGTCREGAAIAEDPGVGTLSAVIEAMRQLFNFVQTPRRAS